MLRRPEYYVAAINRRQLLDVDERPSLLRQDRTSDGLAMFTRQRFDLVMEVLEPRSRSSDAAYSSMSRRACIHNIGEVGCTSVVRVTDIAGVGPSVVRSAIG
jgi:hypothetical protein